MRTTFRGVVEAGGYAFCRVDPPTRTFVTTTQVRGSILRQIYLTLRSSWYRKRPRLVGTDDYGNRFFEALPNKGSEHPIRSKYPQRYVLMPGQKSLDDAWMTLSSELPTMSTEWESWLRHRRANPPTKEEIASNAAEARRRISQAAKLEASSFMICLVHTVKYQAEREEMIRQGLIHGSSEPNSLNRSSSTQTSKRTFPVYPDMEVAPGEGKTPTDKS
ncbi:hypothetical protein X801_02365 [Opisthorchis viverrini]|uniref:Mimitin, mitochondrial n=1 Tax=Opisthorchis viverrini TaxID=6198 RepID=A0A1S8X4V8_OPIVI|nr:hypothetical protein X801_02365 [Opisthorchis viverrini]